ncbi:hypothetical protein EIP86_004433 [Pleurotus ostreatoroseus]|nr:hypothetical protein EIP86_004433 [Pleurotus ostreatoroseus]
MFNLLRQAAPTLTHLTLGTGYYKRNVPRERHAYRDFDSQEMRTCLAPLTALRTLTLKFEFHDPLWQGAGYWSPAETFAHMVLILASFPLCLRRIVLSFADVKPTGLYHPKFRLWSGSWLWSELDLRLLVPLIGRYEHLEAVVFEGTQGATPEEQRLPLQIL